MSHNASGGVIACIEVLDIVLLCSAYNSCSSISIRHEIMIESVLVATGMPWKRPAESSLYVHADCFGAFLSQWKTAKTVHSSNNS